MPKEAPELFQYLLKKRRKLAFAKALTYIDAMHLWLKEITLKVIQYEFRNEENDGELLARSFVDDNKNMLPIYNHFHLTQVKDIENLEHIIVEALKKGLSDDNLYAPRDIASVISILSDKKKGDSPHALPPFPFQLDLIKAQRFEKIIGNLDTLSESILGWMFIEVKPETVNNAVRRLPYRFFELDEEIKAFCLANPKQDFILYNEIEQTLLDVVDHIFIKINEHIQNSVACRTWQDVFCLLTPQKHRIEKISSEQSAVISVTIEELSLAVQNCITSPGNITKQLVHEKFDNVIIACANKCTTEHNTQSYNTVALEILISNLSKFPKILEKLDIETKTPIKNMFERVNQVVKNMPKDN